MKPVRYRIHTWPAWCRTASLFSLFEVSPLCPLSAEWWSGLVPSHKKKLTTKLKLYHWIKNSISVNKSKTSLNYYKLQILNPHFSWQPNRPCWLQSKIHIQFIFYFIILLIKFSYSIQPFHASFHIHPFHASFHIHPFHASLNVADVPDEVQDEFTELLNDTTAHDRLQE